MHIFQAATMHSIFSNGGFVKQNKKPVNPEILSKQKLVNHNILSKAQMRQKAKTIFYIHKDHLGSYETITNSLGNIVEKLNYDPWGRRRNPFTWGFENITATLPFERGFTGHEHLNHFGLINMNGRTYDPYLGRMLQTDNYVQAAGYMQNYNRYSYALNNPLKYTDPDGEIVIAAVIVGAAIGAYYGGMLANNGDYTPWNSGSGDQSWDFSSGKTWGYMVGGAIVGGVSGGLAAEVAALGMPFANTAAIMTGSFTNSLGTSMYTGGQTDVSVSFGVGSYNFNTGELNGIWNWGNLSTMEKIGYGIGTVANAADILAGFKPGNVELRTENDPNYQKYGYDENGNYVLQDRKDLIGHSQILDENGNPLVDWGPAPGQGVSGFGEWVPGSNSYEGGVPISASKMKWNALTIDGVNTGRISNWSPSGKYNLSLNSCVSQTSRALNASGVFNIGIHPYILHAQMYLRSIGVRPYIFSSYMYQY